MPKNPKESENRNADSHEKNKQERGSKCVHGFSEYLKKTCLVLDKQGVDGKRKFLSLVLRFCTAVQLAKLFGVFSNFLDC